MWQAQAGTGPFGERSITHLPNSRNQRHEAGSRRVIATRLCGVGCRLSHPCKEAPGGSTTEGSLA